ncbi:hypothetical protein FQR65_LT16200 [Abscondita terminalis]|nr:hypothetical protein FQR65_LT16200 [Abscondita terminalis]
MNRFTNLANNVVGETIKSTTPSNTIQSKEMKYLQGKRKSVWFKYVCVVKEKYSDSEFTVAGLKSVNSDHNVFCLVKNDISTVPMEDILAVLPNPIINKEMHYQFPHKIDVLAECEADREGGEDDGDVIFPPNPEREDNHNGEQEKSNINKMEEKNMPRKPTLNARRRGNKRTLTINDQDATNVVEIEPEQNTLTDDILPKQSQKRKPKRKRSPSVMPTRRSKRLESVDSSVNVLQNEEPSNATILDAYETHQEPMEVQVEVHCANDGELAGKGSKPIWAKSQKPGCSKDPIYMAEDPILKTVEHPVGQYKFYYLICLDI